jgi:hypothetical protein
MNTASVWTLSREAHVKIANHAWNVYPMAALGFLVGDLENKDILAALPAIKADNASPNSTWDDFRTQLDTAKSVARDFNQVVLGGYVTAMASSVDFTWITERPLSLFYCALCCKGHSWETIFVEGKHVDWRMSVGKRSRDNFNQKKMYTAWIKQRGLVDYTNGYVPTP